MGRLICIFATAISFITVITGCATVQESRAKTKTNYKTVWNACIQSVSDVRFSVSSTDPTTGLIIADSAVVSGSGTVSRLNIQLLKAISDTTIEVKFVPPYGTIGGWGTADGYLDAVRKRVPDLKIEGKSAQSDERAATSGGETKEKTDSWLDTVRKKIQGAEAEGDKSSQAEKIAASDGETKHHEQPYRAVEPTSKLTADSKTLTKMTVAQKTSLRKTPSKSGKILKTLKKGDSVEVVKRDGDWCLVDIGGGEVGWGLTSFFQSSK